ncbi:MAG TPA: GNAT family N-acetyltransferase [Pyrinomonadaceae bacterium]|jgi:GNAT superfamily N-acetyltransferase|nr:GNAT family N-acetyltransferase [Pyrinomonadaceae bacterium]
MNSINRLSAAEARSILPRLISLLQDSVESGASVGFLVPLSLGANEAYWLETFNYIKSGQRVLLVSRVDDEIVGAVQLDLATKLNALHRAEVQKLMVHTRYRNRGIARALMAAIEGVALELNRTLLVLDTLQGSEAENLYPTCGYSRAGMIPNYACVSDGSLKPTVLFYKMLEAKPRW